jgi:phosphonate degradation associated HDIG domain protein
MLTLDEIETLFHQRGGAQYSGEPVTQLAHALQTATLAELDGADDELVTAALLHDLGHLVYGLGTGAGNTPGDSPTLRGVDDLHQFQALPFLRGRFADRVLGAIQAHVDAKRYLCASRPGYLEALSADSQRSLLLQGGVFDAAQVAAFIVRPGAAEALRLRLWDDQAKSADSATPTLAHFMDRARRCAAT